MHGFAKSDRDNISLDELEAFRMLASQLLAYSEVAIAAAMNAGVLIEVKGK